MAFLKYGFLYKRCCFCQSADSSKLFQQTICVRSGAPPSSRPTLTVAEWDFQARRGHEGVEDARAMMRVQRRNAKRLTFEERRNKGRAWAGKSKNTVRDRHHAHIAVAKRRPDQHGTSENNTTQHRAPTSGRHPRCERLSPYDSDAG